MSYTIRPLAKEDLDQVNKIDAEAFPTQWPPANYRQELQNKLAHYIVADDDTKFLPSPALKPRRSFLTRFLPWSKIPAKDAPPAPHQVIAGFSGIWLMVDEAHVTNIAVRKEYRGKGIGEMLIIATIDLSRELKASIMTLEARKSNTVAQNLYKKYGFVEVGIRRGYYLDNREDAIIMSTESITSPAFQDRLRELRNSLAGKLNPSTG